MKLIRFKVPENFDLIPFGDTHEGNITVARVKLAGLIAHIAASPVKSLGQVPRVAIHMGDEIESIWINDPRYQKDTVSDSILHQQAACIDLLKPIKHKLITILQGNHTARLLNTVGDLTEATCSALSIPYGTWSCVVEFYDKHGVMFRGFFTHGSSGLYSAADDPIRQEANTRLSLKRQLRNKAGDCVLMAMGHCHKLLIARPEPHLYLAHVDGFTKQHYTHNPAFGKGGYVHPDHRWYLATGTFLRLYGDSLTTYGERAGYDPVEIGYPVVEIRNREIVTARKVVI